MNDVQIGVTNEEIPQVVLVIPGSQGGGAVQLGMTPDQARQIAAALSQYADKLDPPV